MIRIRNMGSWPAIPGGKGYCVYEVGINNQPAICTFVHKRSDGLAVCLEIAAEAVRNMAGRSNEAPRDASVCGPGDDAAIGDSADRNDDQDGLDDTTADR